MLSKSRRFHGLGSLRRVYTQGASVKGPNMSLRYNLNSRRQTYRCAVVVSKKVEKSAVGRNRIRRRIYEQIRQKNDKIVQPYDIVVTVFKTEVGHMPANELAKALDDLLRRAKIIAS